MSNEFYETNYLDFYDPDKCIGDLGEKWCNFEWRIYNPQLNPRETFKSPIFTTRLLPKTQWYLEVKLSTPGDLKDFKVSLCRLPNVENDASILDVIYKVTIDEEIKISNKNTIEYINGMLPHEIDYYCVPFYKSQKTGFVAVECKLRPNKKMVQKVPHDGLDDTLPVHLRKLLQSGEVYDTIIHVGDQELKAHFIMLCVRLPKLLAPTSPTIKGKRLIKINDLPVSVVKEMLKYAYTGQAYLDFNSISGYKDIILRYSKQFFQRCCWEDNPLATTFFNYETDSLLWNLEEMCVRSNLGKNRIDLLRIFPSALDVSLDVLELEDRKNGLTLSFKFCSGKMPKSTMVSCKYSLVNTDSKEVFELGETETLLSSNITSGKMKLCSLLEVMRGMSILCARENILILRTDFKFCYGSSKSSIENLYEGQFDLSQCTGCPILSADMKHLIRFVGFWDITVEGSDGVEICAHKALLMARWSEAEKFKVKESSKIVVKDYDFHGLCRLQRQLYSGNESK